VDDWFSEFESRAVANQEEDEAKQRIFQGLLKGEALKWYQDIPVRDRKLPSAVHAYNTTEKSTTGQSPYFLVFGQTAIHGIELEVETFRVLAARNGDRTEGILPRLISIENLEETRIAALERTAQVQMKRKEDYDRKIPTDHGIREQGLVLLYDNRHKEFPGKLHTRWMGPYRVCQIFPNGSLQLENLQGQWLDTRVNGSRVKKYIATEITDDSS
jgi:hypothetical protein